MSRYDAQAEMALREKNAGFKGMKIRAWRPNPLDDAEACRVIRQAVGPDFAIMFDRTAAAPQCVGQKVWDYETGLRVARALEKHGANWLEEPFARDDYESHARLARSVDIRITGGEGYRGTRRTSGRRWPVVRTMSCSRMPSRRAASSYAAKSPSSLNLFTFPASCMVRWDFVPRVSSRPPPRLAPTGRNWSLSHRRCFQRTS